MIPKRSKLVILVGLTLFMLSLPTFDSSSVISPFLDTNSDSSENIPNTAYTYDPDQIETSGSNIGLLMNASAEIEDSINGATDWNDEGTLGRHMSDPWTMELPTQMNGNDWSIKSGTVTISGMTSTNNFVPNDGTATHFEDSTSDWSYEGSGSYVDNFWGSTTDTQFSSRTQTYNPDSGHTATSEFYVAGAPDFEDTTGGAGYIELAPAQRDYTFYPSNTKTSPSLIATGQTQTEDQDFSCSWGDSRDGEKGSNLHYSANVEEGSTTVQTLGSGTYWTWGNEQGEVAASVTPNFASDQFTVSLSRDTYYSLYYRPYKSTTSGAFQAIISADWDITQEYSTRYEMRFYHKDTNSGTTLATFSADTTFTEIGNLLSDGRSDSVNGVECTISASGSVTYSIYKEGSSTAITSETKNFASNGATGIISDTVCDTSGNEFGSGLTDTAGAWYIFRIDITAKVRTDGSIAKVGNSVADGVTGYSTVSVPYKSFSDGFNLVVSDPKVTISETTPVNDPDEDPVQIKVTSATIPWSDRTIEASDSCTLSYAYQIPDDIKGYNGESGSLSNARMYAKIMITKDGVGTQTFSFADSSSFSSIRGTTSAIYGYGCTRFVWEMGSTIRAALNKSESIVLEIGVQLEDGIEFDYDMASGNPRVYFRNIDFTVKTTPSAEGLNMDLVFRDDIGAGIQELYTYSFVDHATLPTASVSFNSIPEYWDVGSNDDGFHFECDDEATFRYTVQLVAEYEYWDTVVNVVLTPSTIYYELNSTILTPKPYSYGTYYGAGSPISDSRWNEYWNDNFNCFFVVPKYSVSSEDYWDLEWGFDNNKPTTPNTRKYGDESYLDWDSSNELYMQENPANIYGDTSLTTNKVQLVWLAGKPGVSNAPYWSYTHHACGLGTDLNGIDIMDWDLLFTAPNEISAIDVDETLSFNSGNGDIFYSSPEYDYVYIKATKANDLGTTSDNVISYFKWVRPNGVQERLSSYLGVTYAAGTFNSGSVANFRVQDSSLKGNGWKAYSYLYVQDIHDSGYTRVSGEQYLNGYYRGGLKFETFEVRGQTQFVDLGLSNTDLIQSQNSTDYTYLFDTTLRNPNEVGNLNSMINLSIHWEDVSGVGISGGTVTININHYNYRDEFNIIVPTTEPEFGNVAMNDNGNGDFWVWLDPQNMDGLGGNVSRGYHEFTISASKDGYDSVQTSGNFSILIDTYLEIQSPSHFQMNENGLHHYDGTDMIAGSTYTIKAQYNINKSSTEEMLNNEAGSYYENNIFMTYELIAVHGVDFQFDNKFVEGSPEWDEYVNETYFANIYSGGNLDPYELDPAAELSWPTEGYMNNTRGDGQFYASFNWPTWGPQSNYSTNLAIYEGQSLTPKILEYNVSVYARVNRDYEYSVDSEFQPNDLEKQNGEGIADNATLEYTDAILLNEESLLVKLNDWTAGNFTKLQLFNNELLDGEAFAMGTYDNDTLDENSYIGEYDPTYVISNYQNNLTYESNNVEHPGQFRLRVLFNCSKSNALGDDIYKSGQIDDNFYPLGPLNDSAELYGQTFDWLGETEITLNGWNSTNINLTADYGITWTTTVNTTDGTPFEATGCTYVTPWLNWNEKPTGSYTLYINARKDGFVGYTESISLIILDAPTAILNGSDSSATLPDDQFSTVPKYIANLTTPQSIPIAFRVNFTDITNFNSSSIINETQPVTKAIIRCLADDNSYTWNNISGGDKSTWKYTNLGNGIYEINITYTTKNVYSNEGTNLLLTFQLEQKNFTSSQFTLNLTITKHETEIILLSSVDSDYYYYYPRLDGSTQGLYDPLDGIAQIKWTVAILDLDMEGASINIAGDLKDYLRLWQRTNIASSYSEVYSGYYTIEKFVNGSGNINYNISFSNEQTPAEYDLQLRMTSVTNFYNDEYSQNATIHKGIANVSYIDPLSLDSVSFYRISDAIADMGHLPYFNFKFIDTIHNNTDNQAIEFRYESFYMSLDSNFTNTYRTVSRLTPSSDNPDIRVEESYISGEYYIKYIPDISGYPALSNEDGSFGNTTMELTFERLNFEPVSINITFTITNASSRLFLNPYDYEHRQEVYVKSNLKNIYDTDYKVDGYTYSSQNGAETNIPFDKNIYYNYLVQVQIGYYAYQTKASENIADDEVNDLHLIIEGENPGITANMQIASPDEPYSIIYFLATPEEDTATVTYTFTIWMQNYDPISYNLTFRVVPHTTTYYIEDSDSSAQYTEQISLKIRYMDTSEGISPEYIQISGAKLYTYSDSENGIASGTTGTYTFEDGTNATFRVLMQNQGQYVITINTENLNVRSEPYFLNLSISKDHFETQQILTAGGELPSFTITSVELKTRTYLMRTDEIPDLSSPEIKYLTINPDDGIETIFVWIQVYVELRDSEGNLNEIILSDGISINCNITIQEIDNQTGEYKILWSTELVWDEQYQLFHGNISLQYQESITEELVFLSGVNQLEFEIISENPNYESGSDLGILVINRGEGYVYWWVYLVAAIAIGTVMVVGGLGVYKGLQLRIPFVLRMIDESIDKISKDKFPTVGVMLGRREFVINKVIDYLDICGIEWEISDKIENEEIGEGEDLEERGGSAAGGAPLSLDEITIELNKIESLSPDERSLFIDELKRLDRKGQEEFLDSLREQ